MRIKTRNFLNTSLGTTIRLTYLRSQGYSFKLVIRETDPWMHWLWITSHGGLCCLHYFNFPNPKRTYKQSEKLNIRNNRSEQWKWRYLSIEIILTAFNKSYCNPFIINDTGLHVCTSCPLSLDTASCWSDYKISFTSERFWHLLKYKFKVLINTQWILPIKSAVFSYNYRMF